MFTLNYLQGYKYDAKYIACQGESNLDLQTTNCQFGGKILLSIILWEHGSPRSVKVALQWTETVGFETSTSVVS